jgi:hypothetical protein
VSRARSRREAKKKHRSSEEGRLDHRDHVRSWRERLAAGSVRDTSTAKLEVGGKMISQTTPAKPILGVPAIVCRDLPHANKTSPKNPPGPRCRVCGFPWHTYHSSAPVSRAPVSANEATCRCTV